MAVAGQISEYASSEGQGDTATYQTSWHRLRAGKYNPQQPKQRAARSWLALQCQYHVAELAALDGISKAGSGAGAGQSIWPLPFTTENFSGVTPLDVSDADESDDCVP